jgi:hypothetical protein
LLPQRWWRCMMDSGGVILLLDHLRGLITVLLLGSSSFSALVNTSSKVHAGNREEE